jgi:hypothetical protein
MIGIANIRKIKGLDNINAVYGITEKDQKPANKPVPASIVKKSGRKPIPKKSAKQKVVDRELSKLVPMLLKKNPVCQIQSPVCTHQAVTAHHVHGRGKMDVLNPKKMETCCAPCNLWVEANDAKARKQGHKKSKF